jgi:AAA+ ATPase superfamily predicted ATPase
MDYFPLSLARGKTFCNRKKELKALCYNLFEGRPTLITSPRRYGKTSLALNAITSTGLHYAQFDFLSATSEKDVRTIILKGVGELIGRVEKAPGKILKIASDFFSGLNIKLSFDGIGLSVEINKNHNNSAMDILDIFKRVEKLSHKLNSRIILFFDEFQQVYKISKTQAIESQIRHIAQSTKQLSFIFSGSNRHLLNSMFNDRNRPFYKLCERIVLDRINELEYTKYLNMAARETWGCKLSSDIIEAIFFYSARHSYYVNLLCSRLWRLEKISKDDVLQTWHDYIREERSQVGAELDLLSGSQRKLLIMLARSGGTREPRSQGFQTFSEIPGATIAQALQFLERKDYVYKDESDSYKLIDPMLNAVLEGLT